MKEASGGRVNGTRHFALEDDGGPMCFYHWIRDGYSREERLCVGVERPLVKFISVRYLHQPSQIHYCHTVADMAHHREVMRDEEIGDAKLFLDIIEKVDDLGLDGNVQSRNRLVADDEAWL
jgi:hypothetical protein